MKTDNNTLTVILLQWLNEDHGITLEPFVGLNYADAMNTIEQCYDKFHKVPHAEYNIMKFEVEWNDCMEFDGYDFYQFTLPTGLVDVNFSIAEATISSSIYSCYAINNW